MADAPRYWALIPAAGAGRRMRAATPKQYLKIHGRSVIELALEPFCQHPQIAGVFVALAARDEHWGGLAVGAHPRITTVEGGAERRHSVFNGLRALAGVARDDDWVLTHDAARPCLRSEDITRLIEQLAEHPTGGLLALPVHDTVKRGDGDGNVAATVERRDLWRALTPQMFRLRTLTQALERALAREHEVTDEAQAVELAGLRPAIVEGGADNIKITRPQDIALAEFYLSQRKNA